MIYALLGYLHAAITRRVQRIQQLAAGEAGRLSRRLRNQDLVLGNQMRNGGRHRRAPQLTALLVLVLLLALVGAALAAPALDSRFGEGGIVRTPLPEPTRLGIANTGEAPLIEDLALQRDGKFVGALVSGAETPFIGAVRYRPNGGLDRSFGNDGFAILGHDFPGVGGEAQGQAVALQRDRKVLVAGYRENRYQHVSTLLVRLRPDGKPDRSFGAKGLISPRPRIKGGEVLHDVAVERDGTIVAVGARNELRGGQPAGLVIAYRPDGKVDRSFGKSGRVVFSRAPQRYTALRDIAVLSSGKLLVVGYFADRLFVARFWPDGRLDRSFGHGGRVVGGVELGGCCPSDAALSVLPGGHFFVLAGSLSEEQSLYRFLPDGGLDRSFGRRGALRGAWIRRGGGTAGLAIQGDGKIVISGTSGRVRPSDGSAKFVISILRALPSGNPDRSFGQNGVKYLPLGHNAPGTSALTLRDGSVVVGGGVQVIAGPESEDKFEYELALARLRR